MYKRQRADFSLRDEAQEAQSTATQPAAAAMTAEPKRPGAPRKSSSFNAVVADLEVGECASRVLAIPANLTMGQLAEQLPGIKATLQNNSTGAIRLAKQATGGTYTATVSDTITAGGKVYAILIIERTA